jgi:hypothetical protein
MPIDLPRVASPSVEFGADAHSLSLPHRFDVPPHAPARRSHRRVNRIFRLAGAGLFLLLALTAQTAFSETATYQLTVQLDWDGTDPTGAVNPIPNPHLSHFGVGTHDGSIVSWSLGSTASPGIRNMAVTGCIYCTRAAPFDVAWGDEFVAAGPGADLFYAYEIQFPVAASTVLTFQIQQAASFVTTASMIGPSPDWFTSVPSLDLRAGGGWTAHVEIPMTVYDAGIKSTDAFLFDPNGPDSPPGTPIQLLSAVSSNPFALAPAGLFIFDLVSVAPACADGLDNDGDGLVDFPPDPDCTSPTDPLEAPDFDQDGVQDSLDNCISAPNPAQLDTDMDSYGNACDCDFNNDGTCSIGDFNLFLPDFMSSTDSGMGTDMDEDGVVGIGDFNLFLPGFQAGVPGPSGLVP